MNKKQIKASLPPGVLPMSQERSQEILRHAKNNPPVKVCRTKEELEEIGVIEGEIQRLLPDEHIYRNRNQIVCIHEIKHGETQAGFREEMEKLYQTVHVICHRKF